MSADITAIGFSRRARLILIFGALALPLAGCGGDGGSAGGSGQVVIPTPTPSPTATPAPTPTPSPTPTATPTPTPSTWVAAAAALYDVAPNVATCSPGTLKDAVRQEFLTRINALRALHGLTPVVLSTAATDVTQTDESSLMMAVNQQLSHTPPTSWTCYTANGAAGAGSGNLIGGWGNGLPWSTEDDNLAGWMNERNSASIGHRRWILDPFLGKITYGRVAYQMSNGFRSDAATMKVFNFAVDPPAPSSVPPYVAYPYGDYPIRYFGPNDILSFSAIVNSASRFGNSNVSFANATVTVSAGSTNLTVTNVASDNIGYGIPNSIQWKVTGLQSNVTYTVHITGVTGTPTSSFQYTFKIVP
ncbi:MAG: CAP domain-containing protein [Sphingobium sp.]|nr:CAP domain-containing protein [Sphingobium sp.]